MSPDMLTLVAAVEAYERARDSWERVSAWLTVPLVLVDDGRSR